MVKPNFLLLRTKLELQLIWNEWSSFQMVKEKCIALRKLTPKDKYFAQKRPRMLACELYAAKTMKFADIYKYFCPQII